MHDLLQKMVDELDKLSDAVKNSIPHDQVLFETNGVPFPLYTRNDIALEASSIADIIHDGDWNDVYDFEEIIKSYTNKIGKLRTQVMPNIMSQPTAFYSLYNPILKDLKYFIESKYLSSSKEDLIRELIKEVNTNRARVRNLEKKLKSLEEKTNPIESMLMRIEQAYEAADRLPTDLDDLQEAKQDVKKYQEHAKASANAADSELISLKKTLEEIEKIHKKMKESEIRAENVIKKASEAYSAATSFGLSQAFSDRSEALKLATISWTIGLIIALGLGFYFGSENIKSIISLLQSPNSTDTSLIVNLILSFVSIGGPVWFSWIATKQITQCFRLSEDYAFKAAVSRAYEGYRQETANLDALKPDENLSVRLMGSALSRFDEQPLRLVKDGQHGSPLHELFNSDVVKKAISMFPDFGKEVIKSAEDAIANRKKGVSQERANASNEDDKSS